MWGNEGRSQLHPNYLHTRMSGRAENAYACRVLLVVNNSFDPRHALREIALACLRHNFVLIVTYSIGDSAFSGYTTNSV